jgi:hypothetical protein
MTAQEPAIIAADPKSGCLRIKNIGIKTNTIEAIIRTMILS